MLGWQGPREHSSPSGAGEVVGEVSPCWHLCQEDKEASGGLRCIHTFRTSSVLELFAGLRNPSLEWPIANICYSVVRLYFQENFEMYVKELYV